MQIHAQQYRTQLTVAHNRQQAQSHPFPPMHIPTHTNTHTHHNTHAHHHTHTGTHHIEQYSFHLPTVPTVGCSNQFSIERKQIKFWRWSKHGDNSESALQNEFTRTLTFLLRKALQPQNARTHFTADQYKFIQLILALPKLIFIPLRRGGKGKKWAKRCVKIRDGRIADIVEEWDNTGLNEPGVFLGTNVKVEAVACLW